MDSFMVDFARLVLPLSLALPPPFAWKMPVGSSTDTGVTIF